MKQHSISCMITSVILLLVGYVKSFWWSLLPLTNLTNSKWKNLIPEKD